MIKYYMGAGIHNSIWNSQKVFHFFTYSTENLQIFFTGQNISPLSLTPPKKKIEHSSEFFEPERARSASGRNFSSPVIFHFHHEAKY